MTWREILPERTSTTGRAVRFTDSPSYWDHLFRQVLGTMPGGVHKHSGWDSHSVLFPKLEQTTGGWVQVGEGIQRRVGVAVGVGGDGRDGSPNGLPSKVPRFPLTQHRTSDGSLTWK